MSKLRINDVTPPETGPPPPKKDEGPGQFVAVKCPGKGCGRTLVLVRGPGEVRAYCRDCKTRALFRVGPGGVTGYDEIISPEREVNP